MQGRERRPPEPARAPVPPRDDDPPRSATPDGDGRRAADERSAVEARRRLRRRGLIPVEPEAPIDVLLAPDEQLLAVRRDVSVERRQPCPEGRGLDGDLYVTTRRIVHLGRRSLSYDLEQIKEAVVAGDRLLLVLEDGLGLVIEVDDPRHLRVEIAAARAAIRGEDRTARQAGGPPVDGTYRSRR